VSRETTERSSISHAASMYRMNAAPTLTKLSWRLIASSSAGETL